MPKPKKPEPTLGEAKQHGSRNVECGGREYKETVTENMGDDGIIEKHVNYETVVTVSVVMFVISTIAFFVGVSDYAEGVSAYYNIDEKIAIAETEFGLLNVELSEVKIDLSNNVLFNADSPYKSMIEARTELRKQLITFKTEKIQIERKIRSFELGFGNFVTYIVDSPLK